MANTNVTVNEQDLSEVLRGKVNETVNLQVQVAALTRTVTEKANQIEELESKLASLNGKEASNAKGGEEKVPVHNQG